MTHGSIFLFVAQAEGKGFLYVPVIYRKDSDKLLL